MKMALFGFQLVFTLILLSVLNKLSVRYSIGRRLLSSGLVRYLSPTDDELRETLGLAKNVHKSKHKRDNKEPKDNTFKVPRNMSVPLSAQEVHALDVIQLPYYAELQWLIDFGVYAIIIYFFTEVYYSLVPNNNEYNLSLIWCSLVIAFSLKILFSITRLYFKSDESIGERSLCIVSGCLFFLAAMIVLIADENLLEFGLEPAYQSFNQSAFRLLEAHSMLETASGPTSLLLLKFWLAVWCGIIGALFIFPGMRVAKMHFDALSYASGNHFRLVLLNLSFISPLFIILMWVKPIAREYLTIRTWSNRGTIMSSDAFETTRLVTILIVIGLRMGLIRQYLQSYLNIAPQKLVQMKKESGRITNVDLQRLIARVFYYLCVVTLQYITPLFICFFMSLTLKTLGNYCWSSYIWDPQAAQWSPIESMPDPTEPQSGPQLTLLLLKQVFNPVVFRGLMGFMVWWLCVVWFSTSAIGFIYHSYFSHQGLDTN